MTKTSLLGPWVRRFLLESLVSERNLARNTQRSYRDTLKLLLPFVGRQTHKQVDQIAVFDVSPDLVRLFLRHLEEGRKCIAATRNQRLAAIRSLARFVGLYCPEHVEWYGQLRNIPLKRAPRSSIDLALRIRIPYWVIVRSRRGCGKVGKRTLLSCFSIACFALAAESACDGLGCSMPLLFKLDGADVAQS